MSEVRAYKYRVRFSPEQQKIFDLYTAGARWWWNQMVAYDRDRSRAMASPRRGSIPASGRLSPTRFSSNGAVSEARKSGVTFPYYEKEIPLSDIPSAVLSGVCRQFDAALAGYRGSKKAAMNSARPPMWRNRFAAQNIRWQVQNNTGTRAAPSDLWRSPEGNRWRKIKGIKGLLPFDVRVHRSLPDDGKIDHLIVKRDPQGRYWVIMSVESEGYELPTENGIIGIDRGVTRSLTLSDGRWVKFPGTTLGEEKRIKRLQRMLSRKRGNTRKNPGCAKRDPALRARACRHDHWVGKKLIKGKCDGTDCQCWKHSKRYERTLRELAALRNRIAARQSDAEHKATRILARDYGMVVLEDLKVQSMTASAAGTIENPRKRVAQKRGLNRGILQSGWTVIERHRYKFRGDAPKVRAAYTSQTCPECGLVDAKNRRGERFLCVNCGCSGNADRVAAINIERRWTAGALPVAARESLCSGGSQDPVGMQPANLTLVKETRVDVRYPLLGRLIPTYWGIGATKC